MARRGRGPLRPGGLLQARSLANFDTYILIEAFRDDDAGGEHVQSEHFKNARAELPAYLAQTPVIVNVKVDGWSKLGELALSAIALGAHPEESLQQRRGGAFEQQHAIARWAAAVIRLGENPARRRLPRRRTGQPQTVQLVGLSLHCQF